MEEIPSVIKATFKTRSKKQLDYILHTLKKALGQQNINALSPTYIYRAKIYVLDMDIHIPEPLLKNFLSPPSNDQKEGGGGQ